MVTKSKAPTTLDEAAEAGGAADATKDAPATDATAEAKPDEVKPAAGAKKKKKGKKVDSEKTEADAEGDVKKKKKTKKVVPAWATLTDETRSKLAKGGSLAKPKISDAIVEAIKICGDSKGVASISAIKAIVMSENPDCPKVSLKKALAKAVDRGLVTQVKGKGFSGSFKLGKFKPEKSESTKTSKKGKTSGKPKPSQPLEELFPLVFTWACNPKEASVGLIKKYLVANYPDIELGVEMKVYRKALEAAEKNGQLERLTGKGFSGTFQLVDGAKKAGNKFDDAFENALIAMNEPKDLSVSKLRDYLGFYHPEYNTDNRPITLKRALDRAVSKGWLSQISGKGFAGSYRLMHPYYPTPKELWGKDFVDEEETKEKRKKAAVSKKTASRDSDDDDDDSEEEEAYQPRAKKRGAPTPRKAAEAPPKKKAKTAPATKSKPAKLVVAKKSKPPAAKAAKKGRGKK